MAIFDGHIRCGRCGEVKPLTDYAPRCQRKGHGTCRACANSRNREYEARNPDKVKSASQAWRDRNRTRVRARAMASYYRNAEVRRARARADYHLPEGKAAAHAKHVERASGLTADEYRTLLSGQKGCCALCRRPPRPSRRLAVDHDHATGQVRGLLCTQCNTALGRLGDDVAALERVVAYMRGGTGITVASGRRGPVMRINLLGGEKYHVAA